MNTQLAICVTFAVVCIFGFLALIAYGGIRQQKKDKHDSDERWKEYLRFKASKGELSDSNGNKIPPEQVL